MRIALISPYDFPYPGGVTEHIKHLDRELQRLGHSVTIIAPSTTEADDLEDNIIKVSDAVWSVPWSGSVARLTLSPNVYQRVKHILAEGQFDIVHVHEPTVPILPLAVLRHSHSVNIGTFHAYRETAHLGYEYGKSFLDPFLDRLDGRIAVSAAARDYIAQYFPGDYTIIPNGVDVERFGGATVEPLPSLQDGKLNILFVGRLEVRKGFRYLLRAFPYIKSAVPEARLVVVGAYNKEDRAPFLRYCRTHRLRDVKFIGYAETSELPRYYRSAHVFVSPATGFESFGIVLLEAMAAGAPVVASDIAGYRSVVTHGQNGLLVSPADPIAIADAVIHLLQNPMVRERLSQAGRVTVAQYAWPVVAGKIVQYYQQQLDKPNTGNPVHVERSLRDLASRVTGWFDPR